MVKILFIFLFVCSLSFPQIIRNSTGGGGGTGDGNVVEMTADTTINFDSTMTAAQIQALIDAQPKNLGGYKLTFQCADGTYTLDDNITFNAYYNGEVYLYGNAADNSAKKTQAVFWDFTTANKGIVWTNVVCQLKVRGLKVRTNGANASITLNFCNSPFAELSYCYIYDQANTSANLIRFVSSGLGNKVVGCTFGLGKYGLAAYINSIVLSENNVDGTGADRPTYGFYASSWGNIRKTGTSPTGTTGNELSDNGGLIE